jgi:hypothetical protein
MIQPGKKPSPESYLRPSEIIDHFPEVKERWTVQQIGYLYNIGAVRGKRNGRGKTFLLVSDILFELDRIKNKFA